MRHILLVLTFSLLVGCDTSAPVPIDQIEAPVTFVNHPDAGWAASRSERELMVLDAASGNIWQLTSDWANDGKPIWSPSGTHLLFISGRETGFRDPIPPWPSSSGINKLFIYDLKAGQIEPVDLSWAYASGPAVPNESEEAMRTLGWLQCAAWSPVDSTRIAIGVTVQGPQLDNPQQKNIHRIVLIDTVEKTARLLTEYHELCGRLLWSPSGEYLVMSTFDRETVEYVEMDTGRRHSIEKNDAVDDEKIYYPIDWNSTGNTLLVGTKIPLTETSELYEYDVDGKSWSEGLGRFSYPDRVVGYAPAGLSGPDSTGFIVLRDDEDTFYTDLWLYRRSDSTERRLTHDRMPKLGVSSFHSRE
jgi:dipeptidyl aminopeptidase/acylaminoacyl peptidase